MIFFDAHIHNKGNESKGFIVGLEGYPWFDGILHNAEVQAIASDANYLYFHYVEAERLSQKLPHVFLKYHPRREKYSPEEVVASIQLNQPKCVMIDTLNEPYWTPYDYWMIARQFPETIFIFPHAGGYLINDFVKICHFQPNVWIDFSLTHTHFATISGNPLPYVEEAIVYALNSSFRNRILMGSDWPFFNQMDVVHFYQDKDVLDLLNENFLTLFEKLKTRALD